ncbi:P-loop containing nucleoside triphosphate hydrolase protein [Collybia nuda]|uniref:Structural maintenance of chromosomes protein 5 n=1 Tax=Collybia nuda TaxID=64659 RepID=A0A9P5XWQ7_9AGAR|nr:P-loop containing nucleoside triphosphate hydrolase protein [Collybia nuda]
MPNDSSSAGPSTRAKLKEEVQVKTERTQKDKGKQRVRVEEEPDSDEDADHEPDEEDSRGNEDNYQDAEGEDDDSDGDGAEGSSSRGAKRTRVNEDGDARPAEKSKPKARIKTLPRDIDGYIPGSIVRIQLKNFVTYDYVQFCPGPYLNMILGPNGTGKSSIACAIVLGLNSPPAILGRASDLNSFVKIGTNSGHIEIELKASKSKPNIVIRRTLSATSKSSTFTLNGNAASGKEVSSKIAELNVQVGNLCSFLPQDKVSEFASMSPQQLLRETQLAAGDENLTNWHNTLISAGKELRILQQQIKQESGDLRQMQERNEGIERDVQRYKDRLKIEHDIELLNVLIPVEGYREMRAKFMVMRAKQRKLHEEVKKLKAKNEPAHTLLKKLETEYKELDKNRDMMKATIQARFGKMKNKVAASDKLENDAEELTLLLDRLKKEEKDRARKIKAFEAEIIRTKEELAKQLDVKLEKLSDVAEEMKQLNLERAGLVTRKDILNEKLMKNIDDKARVNHDLERAYADLKRLDDVDVQKLQKLYNWDRDTHDAILWLRQNRSKFKMEVFEPPLMCLTVPNKQFINAVESCFSAAQLKTFVAQCPEDYDVFNEYINDKGALGRKTRVSTWFKTQQGSSLPPPPMSKDEMTSLGFDGYAIEYVDCPQGLYWFLQSELNLHRTAISLDSNRVDVNRAMEAVTRLGPNGFGGGATFINGMTQNIVNRSRYGRKAIGNMTRDIRSAKNLVASTIDVEQKRRIDETISNHKQELGLYDEERQRLDKEARDIAEEDKIFQKRGQALKARKEAITQAETRRVQTTAKLERNEAHLKNLKAHPTASAERVKVKKELLSITKKRVGIAKEYTELARSIIPEQKETTKTGLKFVQVGANKAALQELCNRKDDKYQTALATFNEVDAQFQTIKTESKAALDESRRVIGEISDNLREEYNEIETKRTLYDKELAAAEQEGRTPPSADGVDTRSLEELQADLDTQRANLELNLNTNPGVVEQYEKRKRDIEQLEKTIEEKQKKAEKIERNIRNARENWQPALERLVTSIGEKFSASFDRIGCAGEIRISEHEDYEKWAIDILVKFRDSEKLQLLTGQRQSGGERSLTTILYLLSLTEEARAPFSLVDEINQGMDQRAERMVHNSMVEVTCKPDSAQYFLITPKLLPDLEYHERMKILCVNNGEWLPEEQDIGNMNNMIDMFLQSRNI